MMQDPVREIIAEAGRIADVAEEATRKFLSRVKEENYSARPATIRRYLPGIWNHMVEEDRKAFRKWLEDTFQVDSRLIACGDDFGRWIANSAMARKLLPLGLELALSLVVRRSGRVSKNGVLSNGCEVTPACEARREVFFYLYALYQKAKGGSCCDELFPDGGADLPKADGVQPGYRLGWNTPLRWEEESCGVVSFVLIAFNEMQDKSKVLQAIPLISAPDIETVWCDRFEARDLQFEEGVPADLRGFVGAGEGARGDAARWHRGLAQSVCRALSDRPAGIFIDSRPFR